MKPPPADTTRQRHDRWGPPTVLALAALGLFLLVVPDLIELAGQKLSFKLLLDFVAHFLREIGVATLIAVVLIVVIEWPRHRDQAAAEEGHRQSVKLRLDKHLTDMEQLFGGLESQIRDALFSSRLPAAIRSDLMVLCAGGAVRHNLKLHARVSAGANGSDECRLTVSYRVENLGGATSRIRIAPDQDFAPNAPIPPVVARFPQLSSAWVPQRTPFLDLEPGRTAQVEYTKSLRTRSPGRIVFRNDTLTDGVQLEFDDTPEIDPTVQLSFDDKPMDESDGLTRRWVSPRAMLPGHVITIAWSRRSLAV